MIRAFFLLLMIVLGVYIGQQLPRGAALFSLLGSFSNEATADYSTTRSHQALLDFEEMLSSTREMVLADARTEQEAIEGMRWILRVIAMSVEVAADGNPRQPYFQRMDTQVRKVGGDNPDAEYDFAQINGQYDYIIHGNIGTVRYLGFTFNAGLGMTPRRQFAYLSDKMLTVDDEGNFTIILSQDKPSIEGDWVPIPMDASGILVRQYIAKREDETLASYKIDVLEAGVDDHYQPPTDEAIADAIIGTNYAFLKLSTLHRSVLPQLLESENTFIRVTSENVGGAISGADNLYMIGSYQLDSDEALIITVMPPETRYWNFTLETRWHETLDYMHRPVSKTLDGVQYREDGSVEFVIAHRDPGHPNWLDTSGHNFGFMTFRWLDTTNQEVALPMVKKISFSEL